MHDAVTLLPDAFSRMDFPQAAHALAALAALAYGRKFEPELRLGLWLCLALLFAALGAAGFYWGRPGLPTLLTISNVDAHLFAPLPGIIELTTPDHMVQLFLSLVFASATALTLVDAWWSARAAARRALGAELMLPGLEPPPAPAALAWLPPLALKPGETLELPALSGRRVLGGAGARAAAAAARRKVAEAAARGPRYLLDAVVIRRA